MRSRIVQHNRAARTTNPSSHTWVLAKVVDLFLFLKFLFHKTPTTLSSFGRRLPPLNHPRSSLLLLCCCSAFVRRPAPSTRRCCAAQRVRLRGLSPIPVPATFRGTPDNVGRQGLRQAAPRHGRRKCASVATAAGASPHTHGGNAPLFDGGKGGVHRRTDSRCVTERPAKTK